MRPPALLCAALLALAPAAAAAQPAEAAYPAPADGLYTAMIAAVPADNGDRRPMSGEAATIADTGSLVEIALGTTGDHNGNYPWASVTKQVLATMALQLVEENRLSLDALAASYIVLPRQRRAAMPTVRQLLRHQAGLRNPDDTPADARGISSFYLDASTDPVEWCLTGRKAPQRKGFAYNNCDYIVLGRILEAASGKSLEALFQEKIAEPAGLEATRFSDIADPVPFEMGDATDWRWVAGYGASAALVGPVSDMALFSRALADGRLLKPESLEVLWSADADLGYMALGQWVFPANLAGCEGPVRIVERRGAIGRYEVRNFILPDQGRYLSVVELDPDQDFGEIWSGEGLAYDLLSKTFCGGAQ
ncbi:serine hydrolase [Parerythrobacter aurantius]|uniref:serine hydrolase domain-containing protein n=1 Tax=Parerythrobacter aurantius TaxID=3127706 RepID=UPI00324F2E1E